MQTDPLTLEVPEEILSPAAKRLRAVQEEILARRNEVKPEYVPPPPPPGIQEKTRLELEEGRRRVAMAEEAKVKRPQPKREAGDGHTVPVYRPADFVPNMKQGQQVTKTYKVM